MSREWCLGDDSWHVILVLYYITCMCAFTFAVMCDNLHHTVISPSLLWKSSRFVVIFSIHDAKSINRMLLVHYNGFCDSLLQRNSRIVISIFYKKIFVSNISPCRLLTKSVIVIPDIPSWQSDCTQGTQNPLYAIPMEITDSVVSFEHKLSMHNHG